MVTKRGKKDSRFYDKHDNICECGGRITDGLFYAFCPVCRKSLAKHNEELIDKQKIKSMLKMGEIKTQEAGTVI